MLRKITGPIFENRNLAQEEKYNRIKFMKNLSLSPAYSCCGKLGHDLCVEDNTMTKNLKKCDSRKT